MNIIATIPPEFPLPPKLRAITTYENGEPVTSVTGYYVYYWTNNGIPFYVGAGKLRRAWNKHGEEAEELRLLSAEFKVHIVADGLNKIEARDQRQRLIRNHRLNGTYIC